MGTSYRDIYEDPVIGQVTQGSIFNGAVSQFYSNNPSVYGVIITPRCDIEQKKVPLYYYLPMIRMEDWLQIDFPTVYIPRLTADIRNNLKQLLIQAQESESIIDKFSASDVEAVLRKHTPQLKPKIKEKIELWKALEHYKVDGQLSDIINKDSSNIPKNIIDELLSHKNPSFYFLENKEEKGFIIRMREIRRLTPPILFRLARGLEGTLSSEELKENDLRQLEDKDIYMPLYVIKSPYIEHIMQHFLQQFNRIGIEDVPKYHTSVFMDLIK